MWIFLALCSALFAALVAIFGKFGLKGVDTLAATTLRSIIMAGVLIGVSLATKRFSGFSIGGRDWVYIILAGLAGAASWVFYFAALKVGLASKVAAVDRLSLLFVIVLSAVFLGESIGVKSAIGGLLITAGVWLITL